MQIMSIANRQQQTMSALYGNNAAQQCALAGYKTHTTSGEIFQPSLPTNIQNKFWCGSYINGEVQNRRNGVR